MNFLKFDDEDEIKRAQSIYTSVASGEHKDKKINEIDPEAFVIITTSSEIIGRGFRGA